MRNTWRISGGRIIDPVSGRDEVADLCIEQGLIAKPRPGTRAETPQIDARGLVVVPGLTDLHTHFREPGNEKAETIESGSLAAARGGFATAVIMPNTDPPADTPERIAWILKRGRARSSLRVKPAGCITRGRNGNQLADLKPMADSGCVAFTDDGSTVANEAVMVQAMETARALDVPIMDHALDALIAGKGVMHDGVTSARLGLPGIPSRAETTIVERDLRLCEQTNCTLHIQHVSSKESVELIRKARERGLAVSAEVSPHHLALTDSDVRIDDPNFKMNPPLRAEEDRQALLSGAADGTLQAFATDHAPHCPADKAGDFIQAPFGVVGLETAVGITYSLLVKTGLMSIKEWIHRWTVGPASILGSDPPALSAGRTADISVLDLDSEWTVRSSEFLSRSRNTPFEGRRVTGRAIYTFCRGAMIWNGRVEGSY